MAAKRRKKAAAKKTKTTRSSKPKRGSLTCCMGCVALNLFLVGTVCLVAFAALRLHVFGVPRIPREVQSVVSKIKEPEWMFWTILGAGDLIAAVGILMRRLWGLYLVVVLSGLYIGLTAMHAYQQHDWTVLLAVWYNVFLLIYLLWPSVRSKFA